MTQGPRGPRGSSGREESRGWNGFESGLVVQPSLLRLVRGVAGEGRVVEQPRRRVGVVAEGLVGPMAPAAGRAPEEVDVGAREAAGSKDAKEEDDDGETPPTDPATAAAAADEEPPSSARREEPHEASAARAVEVDTKVCPCPGPRARPRGPTPTAAPAPPPPPSRASPRAWRPVSADPRNTAVSGASPSAGPFTHAGSSASPPRPAALDPPQGPPETQGPPGEALSSFCWKRERRRPLPLHLLTTSQGIGFLWVPRSVLSNL